MTGEDVSKVMEIERLSFTQSWTEAAFEGEIDNYPISHPYVIVFTPRDRVIGYVILWFLQGKVQISNIAVHPDFRRMGIAERVLRGIIEKVRGIGIRHIFLEVRPSNKKARQLYQKLGFRIEGIHENYYTRPNEDALIMGLDLNN